MKRILMLLALAGSLGSSLSVAAPVWDSTGNGLLKGDYNFREVVYVSDGTGAMLQEIAYFGTITFDGLGSYTLSGNNTLMNTGSTIVIPAVGTYSVAANGYGFLSNPVRAGVSVHFLASNGILLGSSTENSGSSGSFANDLFIASAATPSFGIASFNGTYTIAGYLPANLKGVANPQDVSYQLNPDGAGHLGTVNFQSYSAVGQNTQLSQAVSGVSYTFIGGVASVALPANGYTNLPGGETLYLSADTNFVFGGSPNGFDIFVGVRNTANSALSTGLYYEAGIDEDVSEFYGGETTQLDSYYGTFNLTGSAVVGHERLLYAGSAPENFGYALYPRVEIVSSFQPVLNPGSYPGAANVGQLDSSAVMNYQIGAGGIRIGVGIGPWLGIEAAIPAAKLNPSGLAFLDPSGIVNTASSAPFTSGISPGEFITLYNGVGLSNTSGCWTAGPPFPTTLSGVQVLINGVAAPIYCVGPQITAIVPFGVSANPIASIQVLNGGVSSNVVTAYVYKTTPGVFTAPAGGVGLAAAQHGDYSLITPSHPAMPGETIVVYLSGLGSVFPVNGVAAVDGGATGPNGDTTVANIGVDVAGFGSTSIYYAGLTPSTAGLYQINFTVPESAPAGNDALAVVGPNSFSTQALLPVGGGPGAHLERRSIRRYLPRLSPSPQTGTISH